MATNFTSETQLKSQLYGRIKAILSANGWTNVSSKPATDFDVFYSQGSVGDKELYFQLQESNFSTGTQCYLLTRLIGSYTPGAAGVAGTFDTGHTSEAWRKLYPFTIDLSSDSIIRIMWSCTPDRFILVCEPQYSVNNGSTIYANVIYIGSMNSTEVTTGTNRSMITTQATFNTDFGTTGSAVLASCMSYTSTTSETLNCYRLATPFEYNNSDNRILSEVAVGHSNVGIRGTLDDVYVFTCKSLHTAHGDTLTDGTSTYQVVNVANTVASGARLFDNSVFYAVRMS